jgi:hypothetical protein
MITNISIRYDSFGNTIFYTTRIIYFYYTANFYMASTSECMYRVSQVLPPAPLTLLKNL